MHGTQIHIGINMKLI